MHGVTERIETGKHIQRNRWICVPAVVLGNSHELSPRAGTIHPYALGVGAKMTPPGQTIATMSAGDVAFADDQIALRESFDVIAHAIDNADKFMANYHWHRDRFLRPGVPVIDVH